MYSKAIAAINKFHELFTPDVALALLDELEALQSFRTAFNEWHDKTEWVQGDKRFDVIKPWGKHRADVLKLYIDHLKSNLEAAEHTAAVDHEAACSLVEENEEVKRKLAAAEKRIAEQGAIVAAAEKLVRCKGRYHSELNYRALAKLFGITAPDLPPLEHENVHYADAAEMEIAALRQRIAELEAREIKPAKGEVLVVVSGFTGCGKSAIAGEIEIAMKAIGVPVQWANGDDEKRMTGADWLTAIEMYKPTVRIVEVNVPRAAGIQVIEGEQKNG
nr:ead/Ea22-like family protein [uncultured Citrobacter sp.]